MSYDLVKPMLKKVDNPQQLRNIEIASPHIADHDAELWKVFIARDIPQWEEKILEPKNPRSWWKVYRKLIKEEQRTKEEQEAQLLATLKGIDKDKEASQTQILRKVMPEKEGTHRFAYGVRNPRANSSGQIKAPALQNARTGNQVMMALRKQSSAALKQRGYGQVQPAKAMLPSGKSQISRAPATMVRDHTKPLPLEAVRQQAQANGQESRPAPVIFASRSAPTAQQKALSDALKEERAKKEEKLRTLTGAAPKAAVAATPAPAQQSTAANPQSPPRSALSPPKLVNSTPVGSPRAGLAIAEESRRRLSPSPTPALMRKRPAAPPSIFMPSKKKKI